MKTLDSVMDQFSPLSEADQRKIKGGTGTPITDAELQALFNYSAVGGFNSPGANVLNTEIRKIATTQIGSTLLHELLFSVNQTGQKINLADNKPTTSALAFYLPSTRTLDFSNFASYNMSDPVHDARALNTLSHEIFHAWDSIFNKKSLGDDSSHEITTEVDAFLFSGFVEKQLDAATGKNFYYSTGAQADNGLPTVPAAYKTAYENIVSNHQWNLTNYDALIDNLKAIYHNPSKPNSGYDPMKTDHPAALSTDGLYSKLYQGSVITSTTVPPRITTGSNSSGHTAPQGGKSGLTYQDLSGGMGDDSSSGTTSGSNGNAWHYNSQTGTWFDNYGNQTNDPTTPPPAPPAPAPTNNGTGGSGNGGGAAPTGGGNNGGAGGGGGYVSGGTYYYNDGSDDGAEIIDSPVGKGKVPYPNYA
ncbi:hypothetical protein ACFFGT_05915 [Mucilaginibacter angelicae]|uniref:Lysine-specific metallo-endopeptidase domain-containing protein n=1 Tax=Mucilaginibacter angelicae TaxID=869718 RepID=A0ABV6L1V9_9SPHI